MLEKIPSLVCLGFKNENKWILNFAFLKNRLKTDLKTNCTRLRRFVLMITHNMLTQKYHFC